MACRQPRAGPAPFECDGRLPDCPEWSAGPGLLKRATGAGRQPLTGHASRADRLSQGYLNPHIPSPVHAQHRLAFAAPVPENSRGVNHGAPDTAPAHQPIDQGLKFEQWLEQQPSKVIVDGGPANRHRPERAPHEYARDPGSIHPEVAVEYAALLD